MGPVGVEEGLLFIDGRRGQLVAQLCPGAVAAVEEKALGLVALEAG